MVEPEHAGLRCHRTGRRRRVALHHPALPLPYPILPVWCLISVWSVERTLWLVASLVERYQTIPEAARRRVSYAAAAIVVVFAEYHFWLHNRWLDSDAVTERVVHRDRFLRERIPIYGVAEHLRRSGARDEVILAFPPGALFSYIRMNRVVGDYFGLMRYRRWSLTARCHERFVEQLQRDGVSLFVVSQKFLNRDPAWNNYFTSRLTSEYADQYATVFRIGSGTESPSGSDNPRVIPYFPVASDGFLQGFARIVNHSDEAGTLVIHGIDDTGTRYGPITFALGARETRHFNSDDLLACIVTERASGELRRRRSGKPGGFCLPPISTSKPWPTSVPRTDS